MEKGALEPKCSRMAGTQIRAHQALLHRGAMRDPAAAGKTVMVAYFTTKSLQETDQHMVPRLQYATNLRVSTTELSTN